MGGGRAPWTHKGATSELRKQVVPSHTGCLAHTRHSAQKKKSKLYVSQGKAALHRKRCKRICWHLQARRPWPLGRVCFHVSSGERRACALL